MNAYPLSEAQRITTTILTEAAPPPPKTARQIAAERWGLAPKAERNG